MYWGFLNFIDLLADGFHKIKYLVVMGFTLICKSIIGVIIGFAKVSLLTLYKIIDVSYSLSKLFIFPIVYYCYKIITIYNANSVIDILLIKKIVILFSISLMLYLLKKLLEYLIY